MLSEFQIRFEKNIRVFSQNFVAICYFVKNNSTRKSYQSNCFYSYSGYKKNLFLSDLIHLKCNNINRIKENWRKAAKKYLV